MSIFRWPNGSTTIPHVTSEFNPSRKNPVSGVIQPHNGIDVIGFPINLACASGVVTFAKYNGGAGNEIRVRHDDGSESRYKHNSKILVRVGQRVECGDALGVMGTTGQSTGIHLHFETRHTTVGSPVNPRVFMMHKIVPSSSGGSTSEETPKDIIMKVTVRVNAGNKEWSLHSPDLVGPSELEQGYIVTSDPARALMWERKYAQGGGSADTLGISEASGKSNRDVYVSDQAESRRIREAWLAGQPKALAPTITEPTEVGLDLAAIEAIAQRVTELLALRMSS